jgi:hypothetical protein
MGSRVTSFVGLFENASDDQIDLLGIEIPLIQRDFAQGRVDDRAGRIRESFLDALHDAATGGDQLGLDFIYGEVRAGKLQPLDGQQRLTTLFLLHWFLSSLTGHLDASAAWTSFAYATRPSARRFCERLVEHPLPAGESPTAWINDQPWYLYVWRHDPTVQSMLVMLEAIHRRFGGDDLEAAWSRLIDPMEPTIWFHLLSIDDMGSAEDLYIKMNSRGKALTDFETFKAQLLKSLDDSPRAEELSLRLDGPWADVMWHLRGKDHVFDEEFLNYFRFIVELCEWRLGRTGVTGSDLTRAERVFGEAATSGPDNLAFLFDAFDVWIREDGRDVVDVAGVFDQLLSTESTRASVEDGKVVVFGDVAISTNLFEVTCRRGLGLRRSLVMYAVLLHLVHYTGDFSRRLRVVRNLLEASTNEVRVQAMPKLIADVERVVIDGDLEAVQAFNTEQRDDEIRKRDFLDQHPELIHELFHLEDHDILRGCIMAFELDAGVFERRARAFRDVFASAALLPVVTGAMLAAGDYSRPLAGGKRRFGSPTQVARWRDVLAGDAPSRDALTPTRAALGRLLDQVADSDILPAERLKKVQNEWLQQRDRFEWRDYLVRYSAMREGVSGIYAADGAFGFSLCMLEGTALNGYYRDPYLLAVARLAGAQGAVWGRVEHKPNGPWFTGPASMHRWMTLRASGVHVRCANEGFIVRFPASDDLTSACESVRAKHALVAAGSDYLLAVPQHAAQGVRADTVDRIELGAALLADLVTAGL